MAFLRGFFDSTDPSVNLAREEAIFDDLAVGDSALLLYVNRFSVIVGKHQNPWREANTGFLNRRKIPLLRRITGGGTVVHDTGNLCFSFIGPKRGFDRKDNLALVVDALGAIGVEARVNEHFDLLCLDKKISGNSFCFRREKVLHHGTLLINADLELQRACLDGPKLSMDTHAVASRRSSTINLSSLVSSLNLDQVKDVLLRRLGSFGESMDSRELPAHDEGRIQELIQRNRSWEWNYGRTPPFTIRLGAATLAVRHGEIEDISYDECVDDVLKGCRFEAEMIANRLESNNCDKKKLQMIQEELRIASLF